MKRSKELLKVTKLKSSFWNAPYWYQAVVGIRIPWRAVNTGIARPSPKFLIEWVWGEPDENLDWSHVLGDAVAADLEITSWELLLYRLSMISVSSHLAVLFSIFKALLQYKRSSKFTLGFSGGGKWSSRRFSYSPSSGDLIHHWTSSISETLLSSYFKAWTNMYNFNIKDWFSRLCNLPVCHISPYSVICLFDTAFVCLAPFFPFWG